MTYFGRDPETGELTDFPCEQGECSTGCVPDAVTVSVTNYEFRRFSGYLGLPPGDAARFPGVHGGGQRRLRRDGKLPAMKSRKGSAPRTRAA